MQRILLLGATGTIGRAVTAVLVKRGHEVICPVRRVPDDGDVADALAGAEVRRADPADAASLQRDGFRGETFDAVISCIASRTGDAEEARRIDQGANLNALNLAARHGVSHFVLLSAICVQKPLLAFQHAKLAFEKALMESGMTYSIVRPTAFFKSLSGQIERVRSGKPFLVFGDGLLTACKPISDGDLAAFIADCLVDPGKRNAVLPIGGPGPAITPRQQGEMLFALAGKVPRFRRVPVRVLDAVILVLDVLGRVSRRASAKAGYARIGRYYATESMLVLNSETGEYDEDATPETGSETLHDHYRQWMERSAR